MVLNVSCIQAELLKPMIEWKQAGAELMGSGKNWSGGRFDPSSCSGLESALARQLVG